jgi:hypothetical protein
MIKHTRSSIEFRFRRDWVKHHGGLVADENPGGKEQSNTIQRKSKGKYGSSGFVDWGVTVWHYLRLLLLTTELLM